MMLSLTGRALGTRCERIAWGYLVAKGFTILARNYHCGRAEIDLVARDRAAIVFIEVKARRSKHFGEPIEAIDRRKFQRLELAARRFLHDTRATANPCRFDIITISFVGDVPHINHIRHALP